MSTEYTPATENIEHSYVAYRSSKVDLITGHHEFTRWLENVRAEAKAEALEEAASEREHHEYQVNPWRTDTTVEQKSESASFLMQSITGWLRARAAQLKGQP